MNVLVDTFIWSLAFRRGNDQNPHIVSDSGVLLLTVIWQTSVDIGLRTNGKFRVVRGGSAERALTMHSGKSILPCKFLIRRM